MSKRSLAILELIFAGLLWGFGFIATVWVLQSLSSASLIFYRFFGAFLIGMIILLFAKTPFAVMKREALLSIVPGIALWLLLIFQTVGLESTTATNSGFITTLYVIWVPLFRFFSKREKMGIVYWCSVLMALIGTLLIVNLNKLDMSHLNFGDLLTLIASFLAAAHIILIGKYVPRSTNDFAFNIFQSLWTSLPCLLFLGLSGNNWNLGNLNQLGWIGLVSLTVGSSLIAFYLQVRAQKILSPSTASLLFLLESPAACFFAFLLLGERLNISQMLGALFILFACTVISLPKEKINKFFCQLKARAKKSGSFISKSS